MLLPFIVILSLFGAAKVTISHIDHEKPVEYKNMTEEEKDFDLRYQAMQNQIWLEKSRNEFERIPIQK